MFEITIYNVKSHRKNAKSMYKSFRVYDGEGLKQRFTDGDFEELADFIFDDSIYHWFYIVAYENNINITSKPEIYKTSFHALNQAHTLMGLINRGRLL